jgi:hypothetical protein
MAKKQLSNQKVKDLVDLAVQRFPTFGRGTPRTGEEFNPLIIAFKDKPPMFAMGVDVETVVRFVANQLERL